MRLFLWFSNTVLIPRWMRAKSALNCVSNHFKSVFQMLSRAKRGATRRGVVPILLSCLWLKGETLWRCLSYVTWVTYLTLCFSEKMKAQERGDHSLFLSDCHLHCIYWWVQSTRITVYENDSKCRIWALQFWHFPSIFV